MGERRRKKRRQTISKIRKRRINRIRAFTIITLRPNLFLDLRIIQIVDIRLWREGCGAWLADVVAVYVGVELAVVVVYFVTGCAGGAAFWEVC